jgi:hypothetical protein
MFVATRAVSRRHLPAVQGTIVGLTFGLIDIHSKEGDWFNSLVAYLIAGLAVGLLNAGRAWQAWPPLGWCFYLMHRAAIAYGYRPPYVEEDATAAVVSLVVLWPAAIGLAVGAFLRFVFSTRDGTTGREHPPASDDRSAAECSQAAEVPAAAGATSQRPPVNRTEPVRPRRWTVASMLVTVAWAGIYLATTKALLVTDPFFGFSTFYSDRFSQRAFDSVRVGMSQREVENIVGKPLRKLPWNQEAGAHDEELWCYSDRTDDTFNFWRRWVCFTDGKVVWIANDFWVD